jgi:hypothetical protein
VAEGRPPGRPFDREHPLPLRVLDPSTRPPRGREIVVGARSTDPVLSLSTFFLVHFFRRFFWERAKVFAKINADVRCTEGSTSLAKPPLSTAEIGPMNGRESRKQTLAEGVIAPRTDRSVGEGANDVNP